MTLSIWIYPACMMAVIAAVMLVSMTIDNIKNFTIKRKIYPTIDAKFREVGWKIEMINSFTAQKKGDIHTFYFEACKINRTPSKNKWHERTNGRIFYNPKTNEYEIHPSSEGLYDIIKLIGHDWLPDKKSWTGTIKK